MQQNTEKLEKRDTHQETESSLQIAQTQIRLLLENPGLHGL